MLSIEPVKGAVQAAGYFNKDDYYTRESSPSAWTGQGAEALQLDGPVDKERFQALLEGWIGDRRLGFEVDDEWKHVPGWDLTFSAPKSVSLLAEIAGDDRLVAAHDAAVCATIAYAEETYATTRVKDGGVTHHVKTGNLVVATFRHDLSRALDPQLHTHAVVANVTLHEGKWKSLHSRPLYLGKMDLGLFYRQELAAAVTNLGYEIERLPGGLFEIAGVDEATRKLFSTRARDVDDRLEAMGLDRHTTDAALIAKVVLQTRSGKVSTDRDAMIEHWRGKLDDAGAALDRMVKQTNSALPTVPAGGREHEATVDKFVARAISILSERQAAFSQQDLVQTASELSMGVARRDDISAAIARREARGDLKSRAVVQPGLTTRRDETIPGYTTPRAEKLERTMVDSLRRGRSVTPRILSERRTLTTIARAADTAAHPWNEAQREGTKIILSSRDRFVAVQGHAGTAKTNTVLATTAEAARTAGYHVEALAPTASAAETLGSALGVQGATVHSHLMRAQSVTIPGSQKSLWIVDEASLLGTATMVEIMRQAERFGAKVVLVGDVKQLGSVESGAPFRQLQSAGMRTAVLDQIVRQTNETLRQAVYESIAGNAARAVELIDRGGGEVVVHREESQRRRAIAEQYLALSPRERNETIVIDPSRAGRQAVTTLIREGLAAEGSLPGAALPATALASKNLTNAERRDAAFYEPGDIVRFAGAGRNATPAFWTVTGRNTRDNWVALSDGGNTQVWSPTKGPTAEVFTPVTTDLRTGDRLVWTRNEKAMRRYNQASATIIAVDLAQRVATVRLASGEIQSLHADHRTHQHWDHGYVHTAFAAQGRTAERSIVHAESQRINLTNMRAFYVEISRPKLETIIVTDSKERLIEGIAHRAGEKNTATDVARLPDEVGRNDTGFFATLRAWAARFVERSGDMPVPTLPAPGAGERPSAAAPPRPDRPFRP